MGFPHLSPLFMTAEGRWQAVKDCNAPLGPAVAMCSY